MLTKELNTEVWVISDTHLIADSIHDNRQAFSRMQKTSQGKDLYYQETVLKAFRKMAQEKKPAAIVVTGDVTFNGERVSAEKFAEIFQPLKDTKLLVLPGNRFFISHTAVPKVKIEVPLLTVCSLILNIY